MSLERRLRHRHGHRGGQDSRSRDHSPDPRRRKPTGSHLQAGRNRPGRSGRRAAESTQTDGEIAPYRYGPAASPHLAAAFAGEEIDPERLRGAARVAATNADALVCEGVGGLLVPLCRDYLVRDFAVDLGLPLVIAASPGLGTINHTLLTIEAARSAGLVLASVVLTPWPDSPSPIEQSNRETIEALGGVRILTLPQIDLDDPPSWPRLALS